MAKFLKTSFIIFSFILVLFCSLRVDASTYVDIKNYQLPIAFTPYNCISSTTCTTVLASDYSQLLNVDRYAYILQNPTTIGTSGLNMTFQVDQTLTKGYLYSMSTLYCSNVSNVTATLYSGSSSSGSKFNSMKYSDTVSTSVSAFDVMYSTENTSYSAGEDNEYCYIINSVFSPNTNGQWVSLHLQRSSLSGTSLHYLYGYQLENLGVYSESLVDDISSIINESNNKTQESIDNMNEEIKETLNDNFNSCRDSLNLFNKNDVTLGYRIAIDGSAFADSDYFVSNYISITSNSTYSVNYDLDLVRRLCWYDDTKTVIGCTATYETFTVPDNAKYLRIGGEKTLLDSAMLVSGRSLPDKYEAYGVDVCKNKIDETNDILNQEGTESTDKVDDSDVNNVTDKEDELLSTKTDTSALKIDVDSDTNSTIWSIINKFVTANTEVFSCFITMLTLGVVCLILNR